MDGEREEIGGERGTEKGEPLGLVLLRIAQAGPVLVVERWDNGAMETRGEEEVLPMAWILGSWLGTTGSSIGNHLPSFQGWKSGITKKLQTGSTYQPHCKGV